MNINEHTQFPQFNFTSTTFDLVKKIKSFLLISLVFFLANCSNSQNESYWEKLPDPLSWVNDFENVLTETEEKSLDSLIADYEARSSVEISVVSIPQFATEAERFDELTLHIAQTWGIGKKEKNNGILIGFSDSHHRIRIQNGLGTEKYLSDERTKQIIEEKLIPDFKSRNYYKGLFACIEALKQELKEAKF